MDALEEMLMRMRATHTPMNSMDCSPECPQCFNTGWVQIVRDGSVFAKECSCGLRKRMIMQNKIGFASIPKSFEAVRIADFDCDIYTQPDSKKRARNVLEAIKYWLFNMEHNKDYGMGLYLYSGAKGSGKTKMAAAIANELLHEHGMQVRFATSLQILNEIKNTWDGYNRQTESELLRLLTTTEVLVLDDFGTEKITDWVGDRFYHIVNERYVDKKITIYTSNLNVDNLGYDSRICNRIKERTYRIPFPEESVREIIAKENMSQFIQGMKESRN